MAHLVSWNHPSAASQMQEQATAVASPRLRKAAQEFEANFLEELLKPLKEDPLFSGSDGLGGSGSGDGEISGSLGTVDSLGTEALANALASAGGLGIAKHILAQMAPLEAANEAKRNASSGTSDHAGDKEPGHPQMKGQGNAQGKVQGKGNPKMLPWVQPIR